MTESRRARLQEHIADAKRRILFARDGIAAARDSIEAGQVDARDQITVFSEQRDVAIEEARIAQLELDRLDGVPAFSRDWERDAWLRSNGRSP